MKGDKSRNYSVNFEIYITKIITIILPTRQLCAKKV